MKMLNYKNKFLNNYNEGITGEGKISDQKHVSEEFNVFKISAEEAKLRGKKLRGRPARKRRAKKESEGSSEDELNRNIKSKPGDEDDKDEIQ